MLFYRTTQTWMQTARMRTTSAKPHVTDTAAIATKSRPPAYTHTHTQLNGELHQYQRISIVKITSIILTCRVLSMGVTTAWTCPSTSAAPLHGISETGGVVVRAFDLRLKRSRLRISAVPLSGNNLGQVVHTRVPLSPSSTISYRSKGGDALRLASHWPCVTDFSGLSIHGLTVQEREMSTQPTLFKFMGNDTF